MQPTRATLIVQDLMVDMTAATAGHERIAVLERFLCARHDLAMMRLTTYATLLLKWSEIQEARAALALQSGEYEIEHLMVRHGACCDEFLRTKKALGERT